MLLPIVLWANPVQDTARVTKTDSTRVGESVNYGLKLVYQSLDWLDTTDCTNRHITELNTEEIKRRLQHMPTEVAMPYNEVVRKFIDSYLLKRSRQIASLKRLGEYYFPIFEDKLAQYGLPLELKYLPIVESGMNVDVRSSAGAAGLWQFVPSTGKHYGLEINSLVDDRLDPIKSTDAACRLFKALYKIYGDWHLVLAAYNCGGGNVNKAIARAGGKRDYWAIYPYLPQETRNYVPTFIAACYAMHYSDEYGICPADLLEHSQMIFKDEKVSLVNDTVHTTRRLTLQQISDSLNISLAELKRLNPSYVKGIIPGGKTYVVVLPSQYIAAFVQQEQEYATRRTEELASTPAPAAPSASSATAAEKAPSETKPAASTAPAKPAQQKPQSNVTYYVVKKGDTLGSIAKKYHCSVGQLQKWNHLSGTNIKINQKLKIVK